MDVAELWREYSELKQTYAQLAEKYGCSPRTVKRRLDAYTLPQGKAEPNRVVVVMDTTYWGRKYGVMLFKDALTG
ncbi:MAG: helix-turn-helix domain-containing protein, partial [Bacteroidales bacterium]|nr:helix-turn-helix domain-containing protein [Bacteroidales bacterium]